MNNEWGAVTAESHRNKAKKKADEIFKDGKVGPFGSRTESYISESSERYYFIIA